MTDKEILEKYQNDRQPVECWCRCMGYYAVKSQYNKGKQSEFNERKWFTEENALKGLQRLDREAA